MEKILISDNETMKEYQAILFAEDQYALAESPYFDRDTLLELMRHQTRLNAVEAIKLGLADMITRDVRIRASNSGDDRTHDDLGTEKNA